MKKYKKWRLYGVKTRNKLRFQLGMEWVASHLRGELELSTAYGSQSKHIKICNNFHKCQNAKVGT